MVDFCLTEEEKALQSVWRRFAKQEIEPISREVDRIEDPQETWAVVGEVVTKGLKLDFGKILIPEDYGGMGLGFTELAMLAETLAYADIGIAVSLLVCATVPQSIALLGTDEQKEIWLRPTGEDKTGRYIWAQAMTEPTGGNEIFCPLPDPSLGVRTLAIREGDGYRIRGQKCFISNAGVAENYIVLARTNTEKPNMEGCSLFLFHKDMSGFSVGRIEDKLGYRSLQNGELFFDDMWVPKENMLGKEGAGLGTLDSLIIGAAGAMIGLSRAAYNKALAYSRERIIWGKPIAMHQAVASKLVRMRAKIESCKALTAKVIWAIENPASSGGLENLAPMLKVLCSEMVAEVASDAMYILGGYGYTKDYPVEKYLRDGLLDRVAGGANETLEWLVSFQLQEMP